MFESSNRGKCAWIIWWETMNFVHKYSRESSDWVFCNDKYKTVAFQMDWPTWHPSPALRTLVEVPRSCLLNAENCRPPSDHHLHRFPPCLIFFLTPVKQGHDLYPASFLFMCSLIKRIIIQRGILQTKTSCDPPNIRASVCGWEGSDLFCWLAASGYRQRAGSRR